MAVGGAQNRIKIVPHFMRLHEWIALEEGYWENEGLEVELLGEIMHKVSTHAGSPYFERPQDRPFREAVQVANSACEWGSVCNAGAGMGKFVPDLYGVARFAIFARPKSGLTRLADLADVPVGVGIMAGSHFTTLRALEAFAAPRAHPDCQHRRTRAAAPGPQGRRGSGGYAARPGTSHRRRGGLRQGGQRRVPDPILGIAGDPDTSAHGVLHGPGASR